MRQRVRSGLRLAAMSLPAMLIIAGCGGSSGSPSHGAGATAGPSTSSAKGASSATAPAAPGSANAPASPTTSGASGSAPRTPAAASGQPTAKPQPGSATPGHGVGAAPGSYVYDDSGSSSGGTPPTTKPYSTKSHLVVDAPVGDTQHSAQTTDGSKNGQEQIYRFSPQAVYLSDLKISGGLTKEFKAQDPGVVGTPLPPAGNWSWHLSAVGDPGTTADGAFNYVGASSVSIGGHSYPAWQIHGTITFKTSFNGTPVTVKIDEVQWLSSQYNLALKTATTSDITYGGAPFGHTQGTSTIESVTPA